ncbi:YjfI family protein [Thioflexithrix psekupsensis]|uniref:Cytoplasmic protein n=1 Tax=Thioflexithrix psekupsensis TaxID=1570016 RepID=A0A251XAK4_9GAMM|nr:DUF2170 family protein [Thioflexithrix psekupsensis]OUD15461.1 hypothetical protein TPSD3_02745 [Thioflexithrix psekupsensis]
MNLEEKLNQLAVGLNGVTTETGLTFSTEIITGGDVDVLMVTVKDREEFPVYITVDESQILSITHLWTEDEVLPEKRTHLLETLLAMNVPVPLSSFSIVGKQYIIFGATSIKCSIDEMIEEIAVLSDNTLTAIEEMTEYLVAN